MDLYMMERAILYDIGQMQYSFAPTCIHLSIYASQPPFILVNLLTLIKHYSALINDSIRKYSLREKQCHLDLINILRKCIIQC